MLSNITITDLAVVKNLDLKLDPGMSVLTGETGAGKSILLTALGLALGDRADSGYVRPGCKRAEINIEFDLSDAPLASKWLADHELDDEDFCLIRRVVNQDGRSRAFINNRPVTLQSLQNLSRLLIEIHGQHAHLTLLNSDEQRRLLDDFADNGKLLSTINAIYQHWKQASSELALLIQAGTDKIEQEELLRFQIEELQQLDLDDFNFQELSDEHSTLANLEQILSSGQQQLDILYQNEHQSVTQLLGHSINAINELSQYSAEMSEISDLLAEAQIQISEASQQLRRYLDAQEINPARLNWLDDQIRIIQDISRKHQCTPEEIPEIAVRLQNELTQLNHSSERIEALDTECKKLLAEYFKRAEQLSKQRQRHGKRLADSISVMIKELGMPHGKFMVAITQIDEKTPSLNGNDRIEFLVSTNPGLPAKSLSKVASGGELSRISLAIQVATSTDKTTPTMIFDEVDSGIGGGIAEIVGQKMRSLGNNRQVLCVTHLPQVAAQSHHHLFVSKKNDADTTSSTVRKLDASERVEEVARMLGGINITDNTRVHAKEMLDNGNKEEQ